MFISSSNVQYSLKMAVTCHCLWSLYLISLHFITPCVRTPGWQDASAIFCLCIIYFGVRL
jgi:hypothetical protein